jgi:uncharacterized protein
LVKSVKRQRLAAFIFFILAFSIHVPFVFPEDSKSFLWKIQSKTNTVYLLGSIHFFKKELYPLPKTIEEAFNKSDLLAVEANINDVRQIDLQRLFDKVLYIDEDTLESHVSKDTLQLITKKAEELSLPLELFLKQRPWFLALLFTSVELLKLGFDPHYGIDQHFLSKAEGKKRVVELESLDYQIKLLSNLNDRDQELFLLLSLKDSSTQRREVNGLLQAWTSGDVKELEKILAKSITEDNRLSSVYEILVNDRNKNMASKIEDLLETKETYFVIVGAGHLVGEKGIVEILKKKGYQIVQM